MTTEVRTSEGAPLPHPPLGRQLRLLRTIFKDPSSVLDELRADYGPICSLGAGPLRMAVIGGPHEVRELYASPTSSFRWNHKFNVLGFLVGEGSMIVSDGDDHKRRRSSVHTAFSRKRLNRWIPMIVERTDAAVDDLATQLGGARQTVELYALGRGIVLDVVVRALFGERMAGRSPEIGALFQRPQDYLESPFIRQLPHPLPWTKRARVRADRRALDTLIDQEIAERRTNPSGDPFDVLEALVTDGTLSDSEIRDQVVSLIGAGYDTTAASLAWMLWCAVLAPDVWGRLRAEADAVFGSLGTTVVADEETLAGLDVANRTMRETLRLHPAGALSPREAVVDVTIAGHRVPKGTLVMASAHLAGRDAEAWEDPLRFDPDRFVDLTPERKTLADMAWVPFGRGPRACIGFALAQMELTLIIARLAQRLDVTTPAQDMPRPVGMVVNRPQGGVPMEVSLRA